MSHRGGHRQHHAEAVEHRDLYHHSVGRRKVHPVADAFAVVDDVVVCQHDALREARGAAGVLHVADVVDIDGGSQAGDLLRRRQMRARHGLLPRQAALHTEADGYHVAQERQAAAGERPARLGVSEFGAELLYYFVVL